MVLKSQNSGEWSVKKLPVRLAFIVLGTVLLGLGLTHLAQTSNGGQIYFGKEKVVILKSRQGFEVHILTLGAVVQKLLVPDRKGIFSDVVLGFDTLGPYKDGTSPYFGALVGRVANRIAGASFQLDGATYNLSANDPPNSLHGGLWGFSRRAWDILGREMHDDGSSSVKLGLSSASGDEGYPGKVDVSVTYTLTEAATLRIQFQAVSADPTPINMAQHTYFNLDGVEKSRSILDHRIHINSTYVTPIDDSRIPTGEFLAVADTPFDFREPHRIGARIGEVPGPPPVGYDVNYVLWGRDEAGALKHTKACVALPELGLAASVHSPASGRTLEVYTTSPGLQFYSGNQLDGSLTGKAGVVYQQYGGFALETQMFPNFVNQPRFPQCILRPGETYSTQVVWKFSVDA